MLFGFGLRNGVRHMNEECSAKLVVDSKALAFSNTTMAYIPNSTLVDPYVMIIYISWYYKHNVHNKRDLYKGRKIEIETRLKYLTK